MHARPLARTTGRPAACSRPTSIGAAGSRAGSLRIHELLEARGALFFADLAQALDMLHVRIEEALGELVARGLVTSDAFSGLRAVVSPQSRRPSARRRRRYGGGLSGFDRAGRWSLIAAPEDRDEGRQALVEYVAETLLRRYGVVARAIVARESLVPGWRELAMVYRRWEGRGEIRGGRFVAAIGANVIVYLNGRKVAAAVGPRVEAIETLSAEQLETARVVLAERHRGAPAVQSARPGAAGDVVREFGRGS